MTTRSHLRGHPTEWVGEHWVYVDTKEPTVGCRRSCAVCGMEDTPEGHDPCIPNLPGVINACCGHGDTREAYVQYPDYTCVRGEEALRVMRNFGGGPARLRLGLK